MSAVTLGDLIRDDKAAVGILPPLRPRTTTTPEQYPGGVIAMRERRM